ncbi:MAG: type II toxin-antitoxin system HicB family antitoxin [Christensenellales bacterium]|jgi:predicted RNase H-like HicB family nuclease
MKKAFPAIFTQDVHDKEIFNVSFPDFLGAYTFGVGMEEAMEMAKDLLFAWLELPENQGVMPSSLEKVEAALPAGSTVLLVEVDA